MAPAKKKQKLTNGSVAVLDVSTDAEKQHQPQTDERAGEQRKSLFIRSLPATTTSQSLTDLFSESYPVKHATAVLDPATKQCRGYGFVTFADAEDAQSARDEFDGHLFGDRKLRVELAESRHRDKEGAHSAQPSKLKRPAETQDLPQPSRLIVRNLPWTIKTSEHLSKLFLSYGKIKQAYIPKNRRGQMAGFGFVVLRGRKNAEKALEGVNGKELDGRTLAVDWAVSKDVYEDLLKKRSSKPEGEEDEVLGSAQDGEQEMNGRELGSDDDSSEDLEDEKAISDAEYNDLDEDQDEDADVDARMDDDSPRNVLESEDRSTTLFVRNLPFTCTDEDLENHFRSFGRTRYARVVIDPNTERSKGTGFVCFYQRTDADACLRSAPKQVQQPTTAETKDPSTRQSTTSILQNQEADSSGQYSMDGRVLQLSRAVDKSEANRLTEEGVTHRRKRHEDKRRVYLLGEGSISSKSKLWEKSSPTERNMREASSKQRKALIESNPSLHLSLTRLSVRNIPRTVTSKDLKTLAREAVVGFATDVKAGTRQKLSKEELARGGDDMEAAEKARKKSGKGVVKQAKVVFEGVGGSKVEEGSGAGRSRGYGFIEYYTHRSALMGLRWLNGHAVGYQVRDEKEDKSSKEQGQLQDRKKRLIVEFAIENAQVVVRRKDREKKARERSEAVVNGVIPHGRPDESGRRDGGDRQVESRKRKRGPDDSRKIENQNARVKAVAKSRDQQGKLQGPQKKPVDAKIAQRNRIIGRKRAMRQARKGAK